MRDKLKAIYGKTTLSNREAMLALGLSRGRELGAILYTNELKSLSIDDIAEYLMKFKGDTGEFDIEGLSDMFRNCVLENPEKFTDDIKPFLSVPRIYQHALLLGLNEAWRSKKELNWQVVFDFISKVLTPDDFWNKDG